MDAIAELEARSEYCSGQVLTLMTYGDEHLPPLKEGVDRNKRLEFFIRYWEYQFKLAEENLTDIFQALQEKKSTWEVYS